MTGKYLEKLPVFIRRVITFIFVLIGWVLFSCEDLSLIGGFFKGLFGFNGITGNDSLYVLSSNFVMLIIMAVFSTDVFSVNEKDKSKPSVFVLRSLVYAILLVISFIYLVGDTYNPFLYFRF